jgi:hypothetical protein
MNVEDGTEAAQFPEKEYINGIFVAVWETPWWASSRSFFFFFHMGLSAFFLYIALLNSAVLEI